MGARIRIGAAAVAAVLLGALAVIAGAQDAGERGAAELDAPVTVFLVRHAEKLPGEERDPELSPAGRTRSERLAELLGATGVTHLFASEYRRTQATLAPLAERVGGAVEVVGAREEDALVERLRELPPGAVAVVAGHSNTTPGVVRALAREPQGLVDSRWGRILPDDAYDRLYLVVLPPEGRARELVGARLLELRY